MKTATRLFGSLLVAICIFALNSELQAQHRGGHGNHGNGRGRDDRGQYSHHDHHGNRDRHYSYHHHKHVRHVHHHSAAPWTYHRPAKRYVYFRDYNVYYDYFRGGYMTISNGRWSFSYNMPVCLHRVPVERVVYTDIDYYDDDISYSHTRHCH